MEFQRATPPAYEYVSHNPSDLHLPSVPQTAIGAPLVQAEVTLPDLRTVLSRMSLPPDSHAHTSHDSPRSTRSLPRIEPGLPFSSSSVASVESTMRSPSEVGSAMSVDDRGVRSTSVSIDDPDVRIAAEALSGLGTCNSDFARSPPMRSMSHASSGRLPPTQEEHEPLLELFTKAHPWVGGTINGSLSAYSATINYSPRLVQYGARVVERNINTTVSTVGRVTGVESGLRWYYGRNSRTPADLERGGEDTASQTMTPMDSVMDIDPEDRTSTMSQEPPPAYRGSRPPSYREEVSPHGSDRQLDRPMHNRSWSSQVFVMTSGLGVALSETSRNSLRYCLGSLSESAARVSTLMDALKLVLEQYDEARDVWHRNHDSSMEKGERATTPDNDDAARRLAGIIKQYSDDIWNTLQAVVNYVSNSAGGALPDNARQFVRNQLLSLPQRWRVVSDNSTGEGETSRAAHRMIAFAKEGLDMMSQVSQTMKLTLEHAEQWLSRAGRRQQLIESPQVMEKDYDMDGPSTTRAYSEKQ